MTGTAQEQWEHTRTLREPIHQWDGPATTVALSRVRLGDSIYDYHVTLTRGGVELSAEVIRDGREHARIVYDVSRGVVRALEEHTGRTP